MPRKKIKWKKATFEDLEKHTGLRLQYTLAGGNTVTRGSFPAENKRTRDMAIKIAASLYGMGIAKAGAVGCLDRSPQLVIAVSGKILEELVDKDKVQTLLDYLVTPVEFVDDIDQTIRNALDKAPDSTQACAERYLYSHRSRILPVVAMSVVWYGGTGGRLAPVSYQAVSSARFETMAPCTSCVSISNLMVRIARNEEG
jgi:hypothetical protein